MYRASWRENILFQCGSGTDLRAAVRTLLHKSKSTSTLPSFKLPNLLLNEGPTITTLEVLLYMPYVELNSTGMAKVSSDVF